VHNIGLPSEWFFHSKLLDSTGFLIDAHTCDCDFVMKALYFYDSYTSIAEPLIEHRLDGGNETYIANRLNGWEATRFKAFPRLSFSELTMDMKAGFSNYLLMSVMHRVLSSIWNEAYHI
jgi:hypothetical protein